MNAYKLFNKLCRCKSRTEITALLHRWKIEVNAPVKDNNINMMRWCNKK